MRFHHDRRRFLQGCGLVALGAAGGILIPQWLRNVGFAADDKIRAEEQIKKLKLELPPIAKSKSPIASAVSAGNLLYVSGHGPLPVDGKRVVGKLGKDFDVKQGRAAARSVGLQVLSVVRAELGSLDRVVRLVKVLGMVNCTADFTDQPAVVNGFSELMIEVFGESAGKGARSAVGMASLPGGIPVEIEAIFQVK